MRYVMDIAVIRSRYPATVLHVTSVHLSAFGLPVHLVPPAEGTFMDQKSVVLAD